MSRQIVKDKHTELILKENEKRIKAISTEFDPVIGTGCGDRRFHFHLDGFPIEDQYLPTELKSNPFIKQLAEAGSVDAYLDELYDECDREAERNGEPPIERNYESDREQIVEQFIRLRMQYDPFFFFAVFIYIKPKGGALPFR